MKEGRGRGRDNKGIDGERAKEEGNKRVRDGRGREVM